MTSAHRVRLRPAISVHSEAGHVRFFDGRRAVTISGAQEAVDRIATVGRLLARAHTGPELADALGISPRDARDVLAAMTNLKLVEPDGAAVGNLPPEQRSALQFASAVGGSSLSPTEALERLRRHRVVVSGPNSKELAALLRASGLVSVSVPAGLPVDFDPAHDVAVPLIDPAHKQAVTEWNRRCLGTGTTWLPITPFDGASVVIGPLMVPGETCCYECFLARRASNVAFGERFRSMWLDAPGVPAPIALDRWAQSVAVLVILRWIVQASPAVTSRVFRIDPGTLRVDDAYVFPVPHCPGCSAPAWEPMPAPWEIE